MSELDWVLESLPGARQYGSYVAGLCPFHDDHNPSLMVYETGYSCLACGAKGSIQKLKLVLDKTFIPEIPDPVLPPWEKNIPEQAYKAHEYLISHPILQTYLVKRQIDSVIDALQIGFTESWYTFPVLNGNGKFETIVFRASPELQAQQGIRYVCRHKAMPYIPHRELFYTENYGALVVTYGIIDSIVLSLLGYVTVTSTTGKKVNARWFDDLRVPIWIIPDKQEESNAYELANELGWRGNILRLPYTETTKDPADMYIDKNLRPILEETLWSNIHGPC